MKTSFKKIGAFALAALVMVSTVAADGAVAMAAEIDSEHSETIVTVNDTVVLDDQYVVDGEAATQADGTKVKTEVVTTVEVQTTQRIEDSEGNVLVEDIPVGTEETDLEAVKVVEVLDGEETVLVEIPENSEVVSGYFTNEGAFVAVTENTIVPEGVEVKEYIIDPEDPESGEYKEVIVEYTVTDVNGEEVSFGEDIHDLLVDGKNGDTITIDGVVYTKTVKYEIYGADQDWHEVTLDDLETDAESFNVDEDTEELSDVVAHEDGSGDYALNGNSFGYSINENVQVQNGTKVVWGQDGKPYVHVWHNNQMVWVEMDPRDVTHWGEVWGNNIDPFNPNLHYANGKYHVSDSVTVAEGQTATVTQNEDGTYTVVVTTPAVEEVSHEVEVEATYKTVVDEPAGWVVNYNKRHDWCWLYGHKFPECYNYNPKPVTHQEVDVPAHTEKVIDVAAQPEKTETYTNVSASDVHQDLVYYIGSSVDAEDTIVVPAEDVEAKTTIIISTTDADGNTVIIAEVTPDTLSAITSREFVEVADGIKVTTGEGEEVIFSADDWKLITENEVTYTKQTTYYYVTTPEFTALPALTATIDGVEYTLDVNFLETEVIALNEQMPATLEVNEDGKLVLTIYFFMAGSDEEEQAYEAVLDPSEFGAEHHMAMDVNYAPTYMYTQGASAGFGALSLMKDGQIIEGLQFAVITADVDEDGNAIFEEDSELGDPTTAKRVITTYQGGQAARVLGASRLPAATAADPGEGSVLGAARAPKTGDESKAVMWMLVMGGAAIGAAAMLAKKKEEE